MKMTNICYNLRRRSNVATITHNSKSIQDLKLVQTILIPKFSFLDKQQIASIEQSKQGNINLALIKKLSLKGPLGECSVIIPKDLDIVIEKENLASLKISFSNLRDNTPINTSWIKNMILGVTEGFKKQIKLIGVGYKINYSVGTSPLLLNSMACHPGSEGTTSSLRSNNVSFLTLNIGFSHPVSIEIPSNIYVNEDSKKANSDPSSIELFSTSLTDLNNFVYSIYKIKPIEKSFKGTGITIITP